jgi:hypothetical protein
MLIIKYEFGLIFSLWPQPSSPADRSAELSLIFPMSAEVQGLMHKMESRGGLNRMLVRKGGY